MTLDKKTPNDKFLALCQRLSWLNKARPDVANNNNAARYVFQLLLTWVTHHGRPELFLAMCHGNTPEFANQSAPFLTSRTRTWRASGAGRNCSAASCSHLAHGAVLDNSDFLKQWAGLSFPLRNQRLMARMTAVRKTYVFQWSFTQCLASVWPLPGFRGQRCPSFANACIILNVILQTTKSFRFSASFRGFSRLGSAFMTSILNPTCLYLFSSNQSLHMRWSWISQKLF